MNNQLAKRPARGSDDDTDAAATPDVDEELDLDTTSSDEQSLGETEADTTDGAEHGTSPGRRERPSWARTIVFVVLPIVAMVVAGGVGYLRWQQWSLASADSAKAGSVQAATDATVAILSYRRDTVEKDLAAAESKLTGSFRDSYISLTKDVVIPGAKQKQVSAEASVPAAASVSTSADHAVVLVFVNQMLVMGSDAPTSTTSSVRVTLDRVSGNWLVSGFDPV